MVIGQGKVYRYEELPDGLKKHFDKISAKKRFRTSETARVGGGTALAGTAAGLGCGQPAELSTFAGAMMGSYYAARGYESGQAAVDCAHLSLEEVLSLLRYKRFLKSVNAPYLVHKKGSNTLVETSYVPIRGGHLRILARPDLAKKNQKMFKRYQKQRGRAIARVEEATGIQNRFGPTVMNKVSKTVRRRK